jgi:hypothetical protein
VPVSPLAGLAKVTQQLVGAYVARKVDQESKDLSQRKQDIVKALYTGAEPPTLAAVANSGIASPESLLTMGANIQTANALHGTKVEDRQAASDNMMAQHAADAKARAEEASIRRKEEAANREEMIRLTRSLTPPPAPPADPAVQVMGTDGKPHFMRTSEAIKNGASPYAQQSAGGVEIIGPDQKPVVVSKADSVGHQLFHPSLTSGTSMELPPETADFIAGQLLAGNKSAAASIRASGDKSAWTKVQISLQKQAKDAGIDPKELTAITGEFEGFKSGQRALGNRQANIEMASTAAAKLAPLAVEASDNWERTKYMPINKIMAAYDAGTSDPEILKFGAAHNALINVYSRAINPTGVPTIYDKQHASEILDKAVGKEGYQAAVSQLMKEIQVEQEVPDAVKADTRARFTGAERPKDNKPNTKVLKFDANGNVVQ